MPTKNPRVNVTLPSGLDLLVERMARHQRVSKSQVVRELLEAAEPSLQRAVSLMDAASAARRELFEWKMDDGPGPDVLQPRVVDGKLVLVDVTSDLVRAAEQVRERRPARRAARSSETGGAQASVPQNPPVSNRGVKSVPSGGSTGAQRSPVRRKGGAS